MRRSRISKVATFGKNILSGKQSVRKSTSALMNLHTNMLITGTTMGAAGVGFQATSWGTRKLRSMERSLYPQATMARSSGQFGIRSNPGSMGAGLSGLKFNFRRR